LNTVIGDEDLLDGDEPVERGERTSFHRKRDILVAALIAVVAVVGGLLLWRSSDVEATSSQTYSGTVTSPERPTTFPPSLGEVWRAKSPATPLPVAVNSTVVTGNGGEVAGHDPLTGDVRWRYTRDLPLCTVTGAFQQALAVYAKKDNLLPDGDPRKHGGCSEITALWPPTGQRGRPPRDSEQKDKPFQGTRNSDAELGTRLLYDGSYITTTGSKLLLTYRSDLVQTMEYGKVGAIVNPEKQPRTGCAYRTIAVVTGKIAVIERCSTDPADRLTVYKTTGPENDAEKPVVVSSTVVGRGAKVVAMSEQCRLDPAAPEEVQQCTAIALPDPNRLVVLNEKGEQVTSYPLSIGVRDLAEEPAGHTMVTNRAIGAVYWFTGSKAIALSLDDLRPLWTVDDALGPGVAFAGKYLVPVDGAIAVLDPATGQQLTSTPVSRGDYQGTVMMTTMGPMVYEQRGDTLVALR
jgi:outer membrane protein assembly factor BamB